MKKLIIPFLALVLATGCGQSPTGETNQGTGGETQPAEDIDSTTDETGEITIEPISLSALTQPAIASAFELNFVPGVHQLIDEEKGRTFLLITLPHISLGTSLMLTEIIEEEEEYQVSMQYNEVEGDNGSMYSKIYELSHAMDSFTVTDQNESVWSSSTINTAESITFDPRYRVDASHDQNLRITSPGFDAGVSEDASTLDVTGLVVSAEPVHVSLVQGDQVISTEEFTGLEEKWSTFSVALSLEGVNTVEGSEDLRLIFQSEKIEEEWLVSSF